MRVELQRHAWALKATRSRRRAAICCSACTIWRGSASNASAHASPLSAAARSHMAFSPSSCEAGAGPSAADVLAAASYSCCSVSARSWESITPLRSAHIPLTALACDLVKAATGCSVSARTAGAVLQTLSEMGGQCWVEHLQGGRPELQEPLGLAQAGRLLLERAVLRCQLP